MALWGSGRKSFTIKETKVVFFKFPNGQITVNTSKYIYINIWKTCISTRIKISNRVK